MLRAAVALTLLLTLVGCGDSGGDVARDAQGRVTAPGTVRADRIREGDCFDDPDGESVDGFPVVPCDEVHDNQVFHLFEVPDGEYPGQDALTRMALERCEAAPFTDWTALPLAESDLDVYAVVPSPDTWDRFDDRTVVCALFSRDRSPLRGTSEVT